MYKTTNSAHSKHWGLINLSRAENNPDIILQEVDSNCVSRSNNRNLQYHPMHGSAMQFVYLIYWPLVTGSDKNLDKTTNLSL